MHASADHLPFERNSFTAVSSIVAFFFFPDPIAALREFHRVVDSEGGRIAVFTTPPELKGTTAAPYPLANLGHFYEDSELETHARTAGFREVDVQRVLEGGQLIVARP